MQVVLSFDASFRAPTIGIRQDEAQKSRHERRSSFREPARWRGWRPVDSRRERSALHAGHAPNSVLVRRTPDISKWSAGSVHAACRPRGRSRSTGGGETGIPPPTETQFFSTMRPTTLPARNSSIHFWTSPIGSSRIGVGLILPARASAISSCASASVPTMKPSMVRRL